MYRYYHGKLNPLSYKEARKYISQVREEYPQYSFTAIDAQQKSSDEIVQSYRTVDMFSSGKIVFLSRLYANKNKELILEDLKESILENESSPVILIVWDDQKVPSNTRYYKAFSSQKGAVYEAPELNKRTFVTWAVSHINSEKIEIEKSVIYELAKRTDYNVERFMNEINKLKLSGKSKIDLKLIEELTQDTHENTIWELIDMLNSTNKTDKAQTVKIFDNLISSNVDPIFIHSMITRNIRLLLLVKHLRKQGKDSREIASALKIPPFTVPQLIHKSDDVDFKRIKLVYEKLSNLDFEIKVGNIDPRLGLTLLLSLL